LLDVGHLFAGGQMRLPDQGWGNRDHIRAVNHVCPGVADNGHLRHRSPELGLQISLADFKEKLVVHKIFVGAEWAYQPSLAMHKQCGDLAGES
jgi:hypothetical protein